MIAGLARVRQEATYAHVQTVSSLAALEIAVRADVFRALGVATPAFDAFDALGARAARDGIGPG